MDQVRFPWSKLGLLPIMLVAAGGAVGTALREALVLVLPDSEFPWAIFCANVVGSFLLGFLLAILVRNGLHSAGADSRLPEQMRLLFGVGALGGFTTYSALAEGVATLLRSGSTTLAIFYAAVTLVLGLAAAWAGIRVAARRGEPLTETSI